MFQSPLSSVCGGGLSSGIRSGDAFPSVSTDVSNNIELIDVSGASVCTGFEMKGIRYVKHILNLLKGSKYAKLILKTEMLIISPENISVKKND